MSEFWFNHLKEILTDSNAIAYMWNVGEDCFEWAGDLHGVFGLEKDDYPLNSAQFHNLMNSQDVPEHLSVLHDALGKKAPLSSFSNSYKLRCANGSYVEIEESATLQVNEKSGEQFLCGFLKVCKADKVVSAVNTVKDNVVPASDVAFANYGRVMLQQKIEEWFDNHEAEKKSYGYILTVGIDRMALFNEAMGPRYADEIIEETGARLKQIIGDAGSVVRVDGDVYGIFFRQAPHNEMAAVANYIINNFHSSPIETGMGLTCVGISVGGATVNQAKNPASLITMAEMAMHTAKNRGRNCFISYDDAASEVEGSRSLLKSADTFLKALKDDRLHFAFQPVMGAKNNDVSFHECLMRLIDENGDVIPAGAFIPAIEEMGLSRLLDQHALRMAINELSMFPDLVLSVNVSNLSLGTQDWLRNLVSALRDRPSVAKRLIVEITESAVIAQSESINRIVNTLQDIGCRVALDDFGAGYTAFSQLKDLKVDIIKIDKSFIRNVDEEHNHLFIRTLKTLADGVNVETVGEGAETVIEANLLASEGVDHIQGYFFGVPRVERVWLPKDHLHRDVLTGVKSAEDRDIFHEKALEDIMLWKKGGFA